MSDEVLINIKEKKRGGIYCSLPCTFSFTRAHLSVFFSPYPLISLILFLPVWSCAKSLFYIFSLFIRPPLSSFCLFHFCPLLSRCTFAISLFFFFSNPFQFSEIHIHTTHLGALRLLSIFIFVPSLICYAYITASYIHITHIYTSSFVSSRPLVCIPFILPS